VDNLTEIAKAQSQWEDTTLKSWLEGHPERQIYSEISKQRLYTPKDMVNFDYLRDLGFPGEYPYTRGLNPTGYRSRLWHIAETSGFGTPEDTNKRWKFLLNQGQDGVSLSCDLPTQQGYDPDHPLAEGEVGIVGASCPSLKDVETMFDGISMDKIRIRGSTCHPHMILYSMMIATAEKQGISRDRLTITVNSDVLNEYISRHNYIFPPEGALRLTLDFMEYGLKQMPKTSYLLGSGYPIAETGATIVQASAIMLATAFSYIERALQRGIAVDDIASRAGFNIHVGTEFFEEIAKFRALRRLWAKIMKEKYGAKQSAALQFRFGPGTGGSLLTAQQPENNIVRVTIAAIAAILGGCHFLHTSSFDEALAIPTEKAVSIALNTQHIIAHETGVPDVMDPLGGSYYVEALTNEIEKEILAYLEEIDAKGGIIKGIESGWIQGEIARSAYIKQKDIEDERRIIVGVNKFVAKEKPAIKIHRSIEPKTALEMREKMAKLRRERDNNAVQRSLGALCKAGQGNDNLVPFVLDAVKNYATIGEICDVFRDIFGEYRPLLH
jgi:methylmalonyl-CoA mutase N-terminal domain/subunit